MAFDGLGADEQQFADLLGGVALGDELEDLLLAFGDRPFGQAVAAVQAVEVGADQGAFGARVDERFVADGRPARLADEVAVGRRT
ncbi:hypothetical protein SFUMM280S_03219 [Streptomyces fumanus]